MSNTFTTSFSSSFGGVLGVSAVEHFHPNGQDILQMQKNLLPKPFKIACLESLQFSSQLYILLGDDHGRLLIFDFSKLEFVSFVKFITLPFNPYK
ncbi:hypothetical protein FDP41_005226 [Naegleria fowleri]|uniref:Uncharacterized protein n=1 Tax=Naegleria fowleri TaxID=5763 RepID=A0A6A5BSM5_NAEFO|nr:uncharacterized protein FDP41_005226 [Naegleria fowleri]KAF0975899.1 hypothetical protein FDP41_005226 [Naegleria fowleri]